jgi:hypothetical protein
MGVKRFLPVIKRPLILFRPAPKFANFDVHWHLQDSLL